MPTGRARSTRPAPSCARTPPGRTAPRTPAPAAAPAAPAAERPDVAGAVDEVKRLLGEGRITQAVDILGAILPAAAEQHGEHSPVVRTLRKQYAATLMDDGQYRRALPELRRLADERAAEAGPADPQSLQFRYEAAQCLEQLGEPAAALAEYRALLPYYENQYVAGDPELALDVRRRIGHLLLARRRPRRRPRHPRPPPPRRGPPARPRPSARGGDTADAGVAGTGARLDFAVA